MPSPRIAPLAPPYAPDIARLLASYMPPDSDSEPLGLFRTLAVHEDLASRMRVVGSGLLAHGRLDPRDREIVIHRMCARAGAEYEWGVHAVVFGQAVGLSEAELAATAAGDGADDVWSAQDSQLIAAADALFESSSIPDDLWASLAERFDEQQLLELVILTGWYQLISYVVNAVGVKHEPWAARFPR